MSMLGHYASYPMRKKIPGFPLECPCHGSQGNIGLFEKYGCTPKGVIHVGAWDCAEMGCYVSLFDQNVIWVEANPHTYANISKPKADVYKHKSYNCALSDTDNNEVLLRVLPKADGSSLYECVGQVPVSEIKLKTKTLDTLIEEENIDMNNFDFLNIDAEGAEYDVLQGMKNHLHRIDY